MENTDILIIILSAGMSIVLILFIVALVYAIKILKQIRIVTQKAENIAGNVDAASAFFKKSAGPVAIGKLISNIVDAVKHHKEEKK